MEQTDLAYDLRQKYAEIVGKHLDAISSARLEKNYPDYFNALEDLFTIIKHKFKGKVKEKDSQQTYKPTYIKIESKNKKPLKDIKIYQILRQNAIDISNKYETAFLRKTDDPEEIVKIESSLREIEMFLYYVMDKAKMFGSVGFNEGM